MTVPKSDAARNLKSGLLSNLCMHVQSGINFSNKFRWSVRGVSRLLSYRDGKIFIWVNSYGLQVLLEFCFKKTCGESVVLVISSRKQVCSHSNI